MDTEPNLDDLKPEIGSSSSIIEKVVMLFLGVPTIFICTSVGSYGGHFGTFVGFVIAVILLVGVWKVILKYRVIKFKKNRGDYEPAMQAKKEAASQAMEKAATVAADTAKLTSGAMGLIKDAGVAAAEKLERRATQGNDSSPETKGPDQSDIADRLEKLANLHEQGHISDEEFAQQRSRILDEV